MLDGLCVSIMTFLNELAPVITQVFKQPPQELHYVYSMDGGIYNTSTLRNSLGETTLSYCHHSLRKQPTFGDATTGFPAK